jgi:hypothetical protein
MAQDIEPSEYQKPFIIPRKPVQKNANHHLYEAVESCENHVREQLKESPRPDLHGLKAEYSTGKLYKEAQPSPDGKWPTEPRQPRKWGLFTYAVLAWDICLTLIPLMFIVLGLCAASLDQKPISSFGENVAEGLRFSPTIFPIVFAAIAGRLMRCIAQWLAERGAKLGLLEQLVGSQNISSTVERMVMLKRYGSLSVIIVLLWCLSPLGGQSSLRILSSTSLSLPLPSNVTYFNVDTNQMPPIYLADFYLQASMTGTFQASLLASEDVKKSPVDAWGNVKVPMLDVLSPWSPDDPSNPWISTDADTSNRYYTALTGLILSGVPSVGHTRFTIETSYLQLQCPERTSLITTNPPYPYLNGTYQNNFPHGLVAHDPRNPFHGLMYDGAYNHYADPSFFIDVDGLYDHAYFNLLYGTRYSDPHSLSGSVLFNCTIATRYVEAGVLCEGSSCSVDKMRRSTLRDRQTTQVSPFGDKITDLNTTPNLCEFLGSSTGLVHPGDSNPFDFYVCGSDSPFSQTDQADITNVSSATVAKRLSVLLNTAWQVSLAPVSIPQGSAGVFGYATSIASATFSFEVPVHVTDKVFAAIFIATAILLQICAIFGLILKWRTTGPDILGYVSTQTRDNPFFADLVGGSTLDGLERARLLSELKVQIGDVESGEQVGHIAFRQAGGEDLQSLEDARMRKGRYYL